MKFFVAFACVVAATSAGIIAPIAPLVVAGPQHLPVIGPNGVPIDTPAVQQARAAHLAHKVEAHARNGDLAVVAHAAPVVAHAAPLAYAHHAIASPVVAAHVAHGIVGHVGIPETAEVVAAKQVHFAAHAEALARNGHIAPIHHLLRRGIIAAAGPALVAHSIPAAYPTTLGLPAVTSNGVPLETPEVVAAKSNHFAAHAEALARTGHVYGVAASPIIAHAAPLVAHASPVVAHAAIAAPALVARAIPAAYPTTLGLPAVTSNGVPLETPEVVAAKSNHFAAHAEALARNSPIYSEALIAAPVATVW
ncbi:cuticle protein 18.7-like [Atheta coriaria]|uniref:cuticle protein 18.7-like n=1 Tax=Dalotia coriaria TaxID=877792 RepID=UPI0031F39534